MGVRKLSSELSNNHNAVDTPETAESAKKRNRQDYMAKYYADNKAQISERRKAARLEKRDELNAQAKEEYATNPAIREQRHEKNAKGWQTYIERTNTDPAAKKRHEEKLAKRRDRHKERLATDPEYRQRRENFKAAQHKRRKQKTEGNEPK
jgi:hypothetical protein